MVFLSHMKLQLIKPEISVFFSLGKQDFLQITMLTVLRIGVLFVIMSIIVCL